MKPWKRSKRGTQVDRQLSQGLLQDGMGRVQADPVRVYADDEGTPPEWAHYARPDADVPLCRLGNWKVKWKAARTEPERQWALTLRLCGDCLHIYEGHDSAGEAS